LLVPLTDGVITTQATYKVPFSDTLEDCEIAKIKCTTRDSYQPILCRYDPTSLNSLKATFYFSNTQVSALPNYLEPAIYGPEGEVCFNSEILPVFFDNISGRVYIRILALYNSRVPSQGEFNSFLNTASSVLQNIAQFLPSLQVGFAYVPKRLLIRSSQPLHKFVEDNLQFVPVADLNSSQLYNEIFG